MKMNENENDIIEITDENNKSIRAELLKVIEYKNNNYAVIHPVEDGSQFDADSCYIFKMVDADEDTIELIDEEDQEIVDEVYNLYVEWAESEEE